VRIGPVPNSPFRAPAPAAHDEKGRGDVRSERPRKGSQSEYPEIGPVRVIKRRHSQEAMPAAAIDAPVTTTAVAKDAPVTTTVDKAEPDVAVNHVVSAPDVETSTESAASKSVIDVLPAREVEAAAPSLPPIENTPVEPAVATPDAPPIDDERASTLLQSDDANDTTIDDAHTAATIPTTAADDERVLLRTLFDEYILTKKAHAEPIEDLEFEAFATALSDERRKLIEAHRCRDVRFEIKVQSGEVSLLPRLIR
jgi:hypothetical protein